jgi:cytochrome c peroxidase
MLALMIKLVGRVLLAGCLTTAVACQGPGSLRDPSYKSFQYAEVSGKGIIALGQRLFFDPQLSGSARTACATCHNPEFAYGDARPVSISDNGEPGVRHAPSLLKVGLRPYLMWDGRFASLEEQAFGPFRPDGEMGINIEGAASRISRDPNYRIQFAQAFGRPPSPEGIVTAIAAFERTLVIGTSRFDRFVLNKEEHALTPLERYGLEVFTARGHCGACHAVFAPMVPALPLFSDFEFRNIGIGFDGGGFRDLGRGAVTLADRDYGTFRTPTLRNVAVTAPYMHDGSLGTLEEVVAFYDAGGRPNPNLDPILRPLALTDQEKDGLVAFLRSLTDLEYSPALTR